MKRQDPQLLRLIEVFDAKARRWARRKVPSHAVDDVIQEVWLDVFRKLPMLRDPDAFSGWLAAIVRTHCLRHLRKEARSEASADLEPPSEPESSGAVDHELLWRKLSWLPESERMALVEFDLRQRSQREVAERMGISLPLLKKRLRLGRRRLAARLNEVEPSRGAGSAGHSSFFQAVASGQLPEVARMLDVQPEWIDLEEDWSREWALEQDHPLAHARTALVLAASGGDTEMVELLLARGADPNRACRCAQGDTALFAAALRGHVGVVEMLLKAGADPETLSQAGWSHEDAALARREARGAAPRPENETGIWAVDLLAPVPTEGLIRIRGSAETGLMFLVAELSWRLGRKAPVYWASTRPDRPLWGDLASFRAETRLDGLVTFDLPSSTDGTVFLFVHSDDAARIDRDLDLLRVRARRCFVIEPWNIVTARPPSSTSNPLLGAFDAVITTCSARARLGIYPAIDPRCSRAVASNPSWAEVEAKLRDADADAPISFALAQDFETARHLTGRPGDLRSVSEWIEAQAGH